MAGDAARALRAYEKAMRLAPKDPEAHYNMALLYQRQGMEEEARTEMMFYRELVEKGGEKE
jgi:Flp pilus assembly protein TadD